MKGEIKYSWNHMLFYGYFWRHKFYILRMKHDVIIETEHATFSLTLAHNLSSQVDTAVCISNQKKSLRSAQPSHRFHITFVKAIAVQYFGKCNVHFVTLSGFNVWLIHKLRGLIGLSWNREEYETCNLWHQLVAITQ